MENNSNNHIWKLRNVRLSYAHLKEPYTYPNADESSAAYSVDLVFSKDDKENYETAQAGIKEAVQYAFSKNRLTPAAYKKAVETGKWKTCLKDGDLEHPDDEVYKNSWYITIREKADSKIKGKFQRRNKELIDRDDEDFDDIFYSGVMVYAAVRFYVYVTAGNTGISGGWYTILSLEEGERIDGTVPIGQVWTDDDGIENAAQPSDSVDDFLEGLL